MKILIICSNLIGDNILSTGVLSHLAKINPKAKFTFVIGPTASPLYKNFNRAERIIIIKKQRFNKHWISIFKQTYKTKWDIIVDFRSSILSFLLKKRKKYIFKRINNLHHIEQLNKSFKFDCSKLNIYTDKKEDNRADYLNNNKTKYFVIFPGGNWLPKIWPIKNFNNLIKKISYKNNNIKFILVGSKKEKLLYFDKITKDISTELFVDLFGESLTLTAAYMKKSNLFIGNDSGLMHLAVACKLNTIALFGPTNEIIYGPWGKGNIVLRTKEDYNYYKNIKINENLSYMHSITTDDVYSKIKKMGYFD